MIPIPWKLCMDADYDLKVQQCWLCDIFVMSPWTHLLPVGEEVEGAVQEDAVLLPHHLGRGLACNRGLS
jgi:hypothetical protein